MLAVAVGLSPVVAFGAVAWWAHARSTRIKIVKTTIVVILVMVCCW